MKKSVLVGLLLMSSICFAEFEVTTTSTPQNFETGVLGSISVTVTGTVAPFDISVGDQTEEDVPSGKTVTFSELEADTYELSVTDSGPDSESQCVTVSSDNSILNFIIQKYCGSCSL